MARYQYLDNGNDDGTVLGRAATSLVGFWGATPTTQPAATAQSAITAGATTTSCNALVIAMRTALVDAGIMKGGA